MIPIQLTLQGLYSYKERQQIDFEPLIASGLFGLFGAVGSGKSSILEAIMLALYNKTERISSFKNYNIMNLQSNEVFIDFIFYSGAFNKEKYRATYLSRRNSKNFNEVTIKERNYYKWEQEQWLPLENLDNAGGILGMSYENFMKTVIIPQGKFRDFVDQSPSARTQMLKELFPLAKFDLYNKTSKLLNQTKADIQTVEKLIEEVGELGNEDIEVLEQEIGELKLTQETNAQTLDKLRKTEEKLRALEKLFNTFYEVTDKLNHLKADQELFKNKETQLITYHKAYTYFKEKLSSLKLYLEELQQKQTYLQTLTTQAKNAEEALKSSRESFLKAKENLGQAEETKQKCEDLKVIIDLGKIAQATKVLETEANAADAGVNQLREKLNTIHKNIGVCEDKIKAQELVLQDEDQLKEVLRWMEQEEALKGEKQECTKQLENYTQKHTQYEASLREAMVAHGFSVPNPEPEACLTSIASEQQHLQSGFDNLQKELLPLQLKQQLSAYASSLEEEHPCPLCGSTHHPHPVAHATVFNEIEAIEEKIQALKVKEGKLLSLERQIQNIRLKMVGNQEMILNAKAVFRKIEEKANNHIALKPVLPKGYSGMEQIKKALQEKNLAKKDLQETKLQREKLRKDLVIVEEALEEKRNHLQQLLQQQAAEEAKTGQLKQMLKIYAFEKFEKHSLEELTGSLERGLKLIEDLHHHFEEASSALQANEQALSRLKGQLGAEEEALGALLDKINQLDASIQALLIEKGFHSIPQVNGILAMNLNMEWERQEIDRFKNSLIQVEQQWNTLKQEIANRAYSALHHQEVVQEIADMEENTKITQSKISLKQREIEEINQKMARRKVLEEEQEALELRKQNLSELCNLFRGNGFMNYVSTLYLNNLCKAANERFLLLTKNNLSLELNDQNEFIVRDYLNNGKTRLLKTLSGGQTFQASLCLALALAENVKSLNKAEESFFFLDEGFGALDKNSLRVVFDTLKTLRKENRVVGIISHVEELQQEMDIYLEIENDRERGSQIKYSWK